MENLLARSIGTQDGHGGRAAEHLAEMEEIARRIVETEMEKRMTEIDNKILAAQYQAYHQALKDVVDVLEYDIESVVHIGVDGCKEIFEGKKAQKFLSDQILKEIKKKLNSKNFKP